MDTFFRLRVGNLPARLANIHPGGRQLKLELIGDYYAEDPRYSMPKDGGVESDVILQCTMMLSVTVVMLGI